MNHQLFKKVIKPPEWEILTRLTAILTQANAILIEQYQLYCNGDDFLVEQKGDESPVTQADLMVNQFLMQEIQQLTPHIPILSEESDYSQRNQWQQCWLLDPLDGTREFIYKRDKFTINLSFIEHGLTTLAFIAVPHENVVYLTDGEQVPYKYDANQQQWFQYDCTVQYAQPLAIATSFGSYSHQYQRFFDLIHQTQPAIAVKAGSAYKFCMMLEGKIDIYPRFHPTSEWDTSAGQKLLETIGGGLLSLERKPFLYNQRATLLNQGFIAVRDQSLYALAFDVLAQIRS